MLARNNLIFLIAVFLLVGSYQDAGAQSSSATVIIGSGSSGACSSLVVSAAQQIVHEWPTGTVWRDLKVCDPACTDRQCQKIGVCYQTGRGSDYYPSLNCRGMVCTDLVVAAYEVAGCPLPSDADTRWSPQMWRAFARANLNLARYLNGGSTPPEIGDVLFFGRSSSSIYHVSIITEVRDNGLIMHQANSRKCRFVPKIGDNLYEGYDANHQVVGWGRML